jgi:hypothetical protein
MPSINFQTGEKVMRRALALWTEWVTAHGQIAHIRVAARGLVVGGPGDGAVQARSLVAVEVIGGMWCLLVVLLVTACGRG